MSPTAVPKPIKSCDVMSLPLTPVDGFVMSKVDGTMCVEEIVLCTGLPEQQVLESLTRLSRFGAIELPGVPPAEPNTTADTSISHSRLESVSTAESRTTNRTSTASTPAMTPPEPPPRTTTAEAANDASSSSYQKARRLSVPQRPPSPTGLYDPTELDEQVDLSPEVKRLILDMYYQYEDLTYYELLGVSPHATKKQIKSSYYALVAVLHTDNYFHKNLGNFKPKMEKLFAVITKAEETLSRKMRRKAYDETLSPEQIRRATEVALERARAETAAGNTNDVLGGTSQSSPTTESTPRRSTKPTPSSTAQVSQPDTLRSSSSSTSFRAPILPSPPRSSAPVSSRKVPDEASTIDQDASYDVLVTEAVEEKRRERSRQSTPMKSPRSSTPAPSPRVTRSSQIPAVSGDKARRRALATKLRRSVPPAKRPSVPPPDKASGEYVEMRMRELRQQRERTSGMIEIVNAENLQKRGIQAMKEGNFAEAFNYFEQALQIQPLDAQLQHLLATARKQLERS